MKTNIILLVIFLMFYSVAIAQVENMIWKTKAAENFYVEVVNFASKDSAKSRIDIYVQVPYSTISFLKEGDDYVGQFHLTINILNKSKEQVWQKYQDVELKTQNFNYSKSNNITWLQNYSANIASGDYEVFVEVTDKESKKSSKIKRLITARTFNDALSLSDIMLISKIENVGNRKAITPNLLGTIVIDSSNIVLFLESYSKSKLDSLQVTTKFINSKNDTVLNFSQTEFISGTQKQIILQIDTPNIGSDMYTILVEGKGFSSEEQKILYSKTSRTCAIQLKYFPFMVKDVDKAIAQLMYIAKDEELDYIQDGKTLTEREERFMEFWKKRDPNPSTPRNELMENYYYRVEVANSEFKHFKDGWKTDRGRVYIIFGPPNEIERRPFDIDSKPYEIWYYTNDRRKFVFVDVNGYGDYRMVLPRFDIWERVW